MPQRPRPKIRLATRALDQALATLAGSALALMAMTLYLL